MLSEALLIKKGGESGDMLAERAQSTDSQFIDREERDQSWHSLGTSKHYCFSAPGRYGRGSTG